MNLLNYKPWKDRSVAERKGLEKPLYYVSPTLWNAAARAGLDLGAMEVTRPIPAGSNMQQDEGR